MKKGETIKLTEGTNNDGTGSRHGKINGVMNEWAAREGRNMKNIRKTEKVEPTVDGWIKERGR